MRAEKDGVVVIAAIVVVGAIMTTRVISTISDFMTTDIVTIVAMAPDIIMTTTDIMTIVIMTAATI